MGVTDTSDIRWRYGVAQHKTGSGTNRKGAFYVVPGYERRPLVIPN